MIRPARPRDAPAIARVHVQSWHETYPGLVPGWEIAARTHDDRLALWTEELANPSADAPVFVAESDGAIVGFGKAGQQRTGRLRELGHTGEVWSLYVLRAAHDRGLGRALMDAMLGALADRGHASVALWVVRANPAARFYERLGGVRVMEGADAPGGVAETAYAFRLDGRTGRLTSRPSPCRQTCGPGSL